MEPIEEILFHNVVLRFRKGIETQRLSDVLVEDSDYHIIDGEMSKCSNYAHDQALSGDCEVPDSDELLADINKLGEWRKNISERGDKLSKKRKRAGSMRSNRVNRYRFEKCHRREKQTTRKKWAERIF